ncbi:MAG: Gfo/Idh/MocA family oxidoreductase [Leptolyngbya sp. SIO3F4]|nr:Gfo/Idh/MocA family oxidoreductase [Leptolyngbya sp. SIO3F4]
MDKRVVKVAIVGCGNIARRAHIPAWLENSNAKIVALCDPSQEAIEKVVSRYQLKCDQYNSLDEMLASVKKPDVVDICSPGFLHVEQTQQAMAAGCHVLVEKPPAPSWRVAQELANLAREKGVKLGALLNYRYRDLIVQLKQLSEAGTLGKLTKVYITHHGPLIYTDASWLWNEKKSKYLVWEFGIHFIDILIYLLGTPKRVISVLPFEQPSIGHTTDLEVVIEFESGAVGRLEISSDSTRHSSFFTHINAYGTGMDAFVRWFPASIRLVAGQLNPIGLIFQEIQSVWNIARKILNGSFLKYRNISHYRIIDEYVEWIIEETEYSLSFEKILPTLKLLDKIEEQIPSYRSNESLSIQ